MSVSLRVNKFKVFHPATNGFSFYARCFGRIHCCRNWYIAGWNNLFVTRGMDHLWYRLRLVV